MTEKNPEFEYIAVPISKLYNLLKAVAVLGFILGGWFTTMQITQFETNRRVTKNEIAIEVMKKENNNFKYGYATDISTIKQMLIDIIKVQKEIKITQKEDRNK